MQGIGECGDGEERRVGIRPPSIFRSVSAGTPAAAATSVMDLAVREVLVEAGAASPFLGYRPGFAATPFPGVICTSVNEAGLHGIRGRYRLVEGDLLSIDCGAILDEWVADAAISFTVGAGRPGDQRLIETTTAALGCGIAAAVVGTRIGDVSAAIGTVGRTAGYGVNTDFGGHGVGRAMHEPPSVPNEGTPGEACGFSRGW